MNTIVAVLLVLLFIDVPIKVGFLLFWDDWIGIKTAKGFVLFFLPFGSIIWGIYTLYRKAKEIFQKLP